MSRTQPKVLIELVDKVTYKCDQIVEASGIWAVFYEGQPINLKSQPIFAKCAIYTTQSDLFSCRHGIGIVKLIARIIT